MTLTNQQSNAFWAIKAFAVFSIFFAHMPGHANNAVIFDRIGLLGVPLFMLCAGFFCSKNNSIGLSSFLSKKVKTLIIPWLIWGTITFFVHVIKISDYGVLTYLKWVMGIGSWLYFVPVLLCCQLLYRYVNRIILIILGLISMALSYYTLIPYYDLFTPYINPFNFILYFIIGTYLRTFDSWMSIRSIWGIVLMIISILLIVFFKPVYWFPHTLVTSVTLFMALFSIFKTINSNAIVAVGKLSFVIYLSHIQVAGAINQLLQPTWGSSLEYLKVIVAFIVIVLLVWGGQKILRLLKLNSIETYLGYR